MRNRDVCASKWSGWACIGFLTFAMAVSACGGQRGPRGETYTVKHDGLQREYVLYTPQAGEEPRPLLIALHGGFGTGEKMQGFTGFNSIAKEEGFVAVYPQGIGRHWNDGRTGTDYEAHGDEVDDVGFITKLIEEVDSKTKIDRDRVYVTGASNGGLMTQRLACEAADKFAAVASVIGSMAANLKDRCDPGEPVPFLTIKGTEDDLVPYDGGTIDEDGKGRGEVLSTGEVLAFWRDNNGCKSSTTRTEIVDDLDDGSRVVVREYADGCPEDEVILYRVEGGGHTWPGGTQYLPEIFVGKVSQEVDASEEIWDFFKTHGREDTQ